MTYPLTLVPRRWVGTVALCLAFWEVPRSAAEPDTLVLENPHLRVVIEPSAGRVMEFRPTGIDRNVLWTNSPAQLEAEAQAGDWINWGGDKVWPVAQPFWRFGMGRIWPPDDATDGSPAKVAESSEHSVRLVFPVSEYFHSRLEREFELAADAPVLRIRNRITQLKPSPFPAQVWSVTQVPLPQRVLLEVAENAHPEVEQPVNLNALRSSPPLGPQAFAEGAVAQGEGWVRLRPLGSDSQKIGTLGSWIAGVWDDGVLLQRVPFEPSGMYPEATSLQFYHDARYGELETLGAARLLQPGERLEVMVSWHWLPTVDPEIDDASLTTHLTTPPPDAEPVYRNSP